MRTSPLRSLLCASLLAAPLCGGAASPGGTWSIVESPNTADLRTHNFLTATDCVSATDCWAVGYYNNNVSTYQTLIQHWDGASWSLVPSPNTGTNHSNVLRAVSCVSANDCWAIGMSSEPGSPQRTLVLHWDGTAWTRVDSPNSGDSDYNYLFGVACASASDCWAVGYRSSASGFQTLVLRWNGSAWSIAASPNAGGTQSFLEGVTCVAANDCWAVGWSVNATTGNNQTLIERWNGTAWAIVTSANALLSTHNDLHGVTCVAANDCWAVGASNNGSAQQTLVERWDGTAWTVASSPSTGLTDNNTLRAVACSSATECFAAGSHVADADQTLVLRWDGSQWTAVTTPNSGAAEDNTLFGVTCLPGTAGCWAAGFANANGIHDAKILRWSAGAWSEAFVPNYTAAQHNTLLGVTCLPEAGCRAVGSHADAGVQSTLVQGWDGNAWAIQPSGYTSLTESNLLYDVSCATANDCWAVGYYLGATGWQTLTLRWNGAGWPIVDSPNVAGGNNFLTDVACVSASDCWAVGFNDIGVYQTLILHWDGSAWSIVASPNTDVASENRLSGVSCVAADDCWAVGFHKVDGFLQRTLALHWDGSAWTIVATPNTDAQQNNYFEDVACSSSSACFAVGAYSPGALGTGQPLIQRWSGSAWSLVSAPQPSANSNNYLRGVTCVSADDCWAVGDFFSEGYARSLVEHWDGSAWAVVATPNTRTTQGNRLVSVSCADAAYCFGVGYSTDDNGTFRTLIQNYVASPAQQPDPFGFIERTGVATSVFVTSETRVITGFSGTLPVSIDAGAQFRINNGSWTGTPGSIASGSTLSVRHVSASAASTPKTATVTIGTATAAFTSVTSALDRAPDAFGFVTQSGVAPGALVESNVITLSGYNSAIALQPGPGLSYRIGGGDWTTASGTLQVGQTVQVRHAATTTSLGYTKTWLKAGGVVGYFTTRTQ